MLDAPMLKKLRSTLKWLGQHLSASGHSRLGDGSRLVRRGRDFYRYEEDGLVVDLQIDMVDGNPSRVIYKSTMLGRSAGTEGASSAQSFDRDELAQKIGRFLQSKGFSVEIED